MRDWLARRALDAWNRGDSVAFVCLGNICRSPFAEAVARERAPGRTLVSAGSRARPGRSSPAQAVRSARAWRADLRAHRAQLLSHQLAAESDAIFVFDIYNLRQVLTEHPRALKRVHPLGALASDGPLFISDPFGGDAATFDETFGQIAAAIPGVDRRPATTGRASRFPKAAASPALSPAEAA